MQHGRAPFDRSDALPQQEHIEELQRLITDYEQAIRELQAASDVAVNEANALTRENTAAEQELASILGPEQVAAWLRHQLPEARDVVDVRLPDANLPQRVLSLLQRDASLLRGSARNIVHAVSQAGHSHDTRFQDLQHSSFDGAAAVLHQMLQLMKTACLDMLRREQNLVNLQEFLRRHHELLTTSRRLSETLLEVKANEDAEDVLASVAGLPQAAAPAASAPQPASPGPSGNEALLGLAHHAMPGAMVAFPPPPLPPPPWHV